MRQLTNRLGSCRGGVRGQPGPHRGIRAIDRSCTARTSEAQMPILPFTRPGGAPPALKWHLQPPVVHNEQSISPDRLCESRPLSAALTRTWTPWLAALWDLWICVMRGGFDCV